MDNKEVKNINEIKYILERRFLAFVVDMIIYGVILLIVLKVILINSIYISEFIEEWQIFVFIIILDMIYHYICYLMFDTTIGGNICNLKLVSKNNQKLTNIQKLKRSILKIISKYALLGTPLLVSYTDNRETLYDKVLGINVVSRKEETKEIKERILGLKFNVRVGGIIFLIITVPISYIMYTLFSLASSVEGDEEYINIYIFFNMLFIQMIIILFVNTILSSLKLKYITKYSKDNELEKDKEEINEEKNELKKAENKKDIYKPERLKDNIINCRIKAYFIDCIILFIVYFILRGFVTDEYFYFVYIFLYILKDFIYLVVLDIIYYFLCNLVFSTTIGGLVFQIITVNKEGKKLTIIENVLRSIMKEISKLLLFIPFLYTYALKEEMWYDKILKTRVISKEEYKNR